MVQEEKEVGGDWRREVGNFKALVEGCVGRGHGAEVKGRLKGVGGRVGEYVREDDGKGR